MSRISGAKFENLEIFFLALAAGIFLTWGVNKAGVILDDFFVWQLVKNDPQAFLAQSGIEPIEISKPLRNSAVKDLSPQEFSAKSILAAEVQPDGFIKFLFKKNPEQKLPIASISKLMTAKIVLENMDLMRPIKISQRAVAQEEAKGQLKAGETLLAHDLLYITLMESSNDAAYALAEQFGLENFVKQMQNKAEVMGLHDTFFANPTGVDPNNPGQAYNYSTARDLVKLTQNLLVDNHKIWEILSTDTIDLYRPDGEFHHTLVNTNEPIADIPRFVGAKTGWTPMAQGCLLLVQKPPAGDGFLIYVILGSDDRFVEMRKLVEWVNEAWRWPRN